MAVRNSKSPLNKPCPCGSGRKYKKCCLIQQVTGSSHKLIATPAAQYINARIKSKHVDSNNIVTAVETAMY